MVVEASNQEGNGDQHERDREQRYLENVEFHILPGDPRNLVLLLVPVGASQQGQSSSGLPPRADSWSINRRMLARAAASSAAKRLRRAETVAVWAVA